MISKKQPVSCTHGHVTLVERHLHACARCTRRRVPRSCPWPRSPAPASVAAPPGSALTNTCMPAGSAGKVDRLHESSFLRIIEHDGYSYCVLRILGEM